MSTLRLKIIIGILIVVSGTAGYLAYTKYKAAYGYIAGLADAKTARQLGRQIKFKDLSFSLFNGITISEPCVSRAPNFLKGTFFCAKSATLQPSMSALFNNKVYFNSLQFEDAVIKLKEEGGHWDFEDLLAKLPKTNKGLHLTWNAGNLIFKNARLEADMQSGTRSISLENTDLTITHASSLAGNFSFSLSGKLLTAINQQLLQTMLSGKTELNFDYDNLNSCTGNVLLTDASFGATTLKNAVLNWQLFGIKNKNTEKNYSIDLKAEELTSPALSMPFRENINSILNTLSSITGRQTPKLDDLLVDEFVFSASLHDGVFKIKRFVFDSNLFIFNAKYELNMPANSISAGIDAQLAQSKLAINACGDPNAPEITPPMSDTLHTKIKEAIVAINTALLKIFPI